MKKIAFLMKNEFLAKNGKNRVLGGKKGFAATPFWKKIAFLGQKTKL
jgi:hypothetical protein